jgi:hypothetical protein
MAKVQDGDYIQMIASMAGDTISWAPDQVLRVGTDIDVATARALVDLPEEDPRARHLTQEEGEWLFRQQNLTDLDEEKRVAHVPPPAREQAPDPASTSSDQDDSSGDGDDDGDQEGEMRDEGEKQETSSAEAGMETATAPQAEQRETATQPRGRRKRVKPPEKDADKKES